MSSSNSKKFHVTLPLAEGTEIEQIATTRGVPAAQIIRERLSQWHPLPSGNTQPPQEGISTAPETMDFAVLTDQLQQVSKQLNDLQESVQRLSDRSASTQPDPQLRTAFQPTYARLQQLETQVGVIGSLMQQSVQQIAKHQVRLEGWLEAVYVLVQPLLVDHQPEEIQTDRQKWINELQQRLEQHLEAHK